MPFNEKLADRIRVSLAKVKGVKEKKMFGGIAFMVNDKMCVGVHKDDLILRCAPEQTDELLTKKGVKTFDLTGKAMKGWLLIDPEATSGKKDLDHWINLSLESNKKIKSSKKPGRK
jgi:TfoX/Sxy family transcriptional regulator of competence genes